MDRQMMQHHYMMLALNLALSLVIMYIAMFAMISSWGEFVQNINFFYMALVMWAPMAIIMLLTMKSMYMNDKLNVALHVAFAAILVLSLIGIRAQGLVGDRQFAQSSQDVGGTCRTQQHQPAIAQGQGEYAGAIGDEAERLAQVAQ